MRYLAVGLLLGLIAVFAGCSSRAEWSSAAVVAEFQKAGLEAAEPRPMIVEDYGPAPKRAKEGTRFFLPSLGNAASARVMTFETLEDLEVARSYYTELSRASAGLFSWVFVREKVLVQINGTLPEGTARKYEKTLDAMKP